MILIPEEAAFFLAALAVVLAVVPSTPFLPRGTGVLAVGTAEAALDSGMSTSSDSSA